MSGITIDMSDASPEAEQRAVDRVRNEFFMARAERAAERAEAERIAARLPLAAFQRERLVAALRELSLPGSAAAIEQATTTNIDPIMADVGRRILGCVDSSRASWAALNEGVRRYNELVAVLKDEPVRTADSS